MLFTLIFALVMISIFASIIYGIGASPHTKMRLAQGRTMAYGGLWMVGLVLGIPFIMGLILLLGTCWSATQIPEARRDAKLERKKFDAL